MATFSLGSAAAVPGSPGVFIQESAGKASGATLADFSTVYMLVETAQSVSTTVFPFNRPIPITSLNDYKALVGGSVPGTRIPLLSYNCVNSFFQNAQVGDLRVVRVGSPNQIVEVEIFPSGTKVNSTGVPSVLLAGDTVYVQLLINGIPLVAGDGSTGYTSDGEYLGVPVVIPVNYVAGDEANNRRISGIIATAIAAAVESNPSVSASVHVRSFGLVNDLDTSSNSENAFVTISGATFDASVTVTPLATPVGTVSVLMQNAYNISNIVGLQNEVVRVPQDYIQCITTTFDGQQDQGYLITPTAYAQFDSTGRASVGAAAAAHCASNAFKWMALADAGPYLVTDVNAYSLYTPHQAAANLVQGLKYLVDNAIYEWTGEDVTYDRANYNTIQYGVSAQIAVEESVNSLAADAQVGLLDSGIYTGVSAAGDANIGKFTFDAANYWPVTLEIQEVVIGGASSTSNDLNAYNGTTLYVIAPPFDMVNDGDYSRNVVYLASTIQDANAILSQVTVANGSTYLTTAPTGAITVAAPTGTTFTATYAAPYWNLGDQININGQSSNLLQNTSGSAQYFNALHLPATLQNPTSTYRLGFTTRTIYNPSVSITAYGGTVAAYSGKAVVTAVAHGLVDGQKLYFTQPVTAGTSTLLKATTKVVVFPYYVKVVTVNTFVLADSFTQYSSGSYISFPSAPISDFVTVAYTELLGGGFNTINLYEIEALPVIRGRKYAFSAGTIADEAAAATVTPATSATAPGVSLYLNNSSVTLGKTLISPYGEDTQAGWLPKLNLVDPGTTTTSIENYYCVPTSAQNAAGEAFVVPALDAISGGTYNPVGTSTTGPVAILGAIAGGSGYTSGTYTGVPLTGGTGSGATADITVAAGIVTAVTINSTGFGYTAANTLSASTYYLGAGTLFTVTVTTVTVGAGTGLLSGTTPYAQAAGLVNGNGRTDLQGLIRNITGVYFTVVTAAGFAPDGSTAVVIGDRMVATFNGSTSSWKVVPAAILGGDLTSVGQPLYASQVKMSFLEAQAPTASLWNYDAITSTEIIDAALRGVFTAGNPTAVFVEAGVDNVNRLLDDSQRYFNPQGFIAFYGPWVKNASEQFIPPTPYVAGVAVRRYRSEGYQFPPAGVKYQLADAIGAQISVNSAQQNLLNPKGCNILRVLPGYPQTAVFIWGGRTRVNSADSEQRLYQFVNTRVILNVVYGSLRSAFDNQIFNVIDGFGIVYNQIILVGNSILNQLYVKGALFGRNPSDAFQVVCDDRINNSETLEDGIVYAQVFVVPVPTLERIQIDLVRVAIGNMSKELDIRGLGQ